MNTVLFLKGIAIQRPISFLVNEVMIVRVVPEQPQSNLSSTHLTDEALRARIILFCQVLTIIPRSPKRLLRTPNRISMKIDYVTPRATTYSNREFYLKREICCCSL
jgi:hypothetical protein